MATALFNDNFNEKLLQITKVNFIKANEATTVKFTNIKQRNSHRLFRFDFGPKCAYACILKSCMTQTTFKIQITLKHVIEIQNKIYFES